MISDTLHDAICEIEDYQRAWPESYSDWADDIEVVKKVMAALMNRLDQPLGAPNIAETLSPKERERFKGPRYSMIKGSA